MVRTKVVLPALALALLAALALPAILPPGAARAAGDGEKPTVHETYQVALNDVGDGRVVDTIKYSRDDYAVIKKVERKKRGFLTRRFNDEDDKGELVDFRTDLDDSTHSVVITYDKPGMAYNTRGEFVFYGGFDSKPKSTAGNKLTFEETYTVNSEFTLFSDQVFKTTTEVILPPGASGISYDGGDKAIKYRMPPARTLYGLWSEQKVALSVVFGLLTLVFGALLAFVAARKPPASASVPPQAQIPPQGAVKPGAQAPQAQIQPQGADIPPDGPAAATGQEFCTQCGSPLTPGARFCTNCGAGVRPPGPGGAP